MTYEKFKSKARSLDETITDTTINNFTRHILLLFIIVSTSLAVITFICTRQNFTWVAISYIVDILAFKTILDYALVNKDYFYTVKKTMHKYYLVITMLAIASASLVCVFV